MSAGWDALQALAAAAGTVEAVRVFPLGASVTPPAVVVGPPRLEWSTNCAAASNATFSVFVIGALDDRAIEGLLDLAPLVAAAIEEGTPAVVLSADPGTYTSAGSGELPAYELTVEYPIS